jgi:ribonuclease HI
LALSSLLFLRHGSNGISTYIARHLILTLILPKMLWASPAWWTGADNILSPLVTAYHSAARWATGLPPSTRISNLLTCAHLPPLQTYLDYLSTKFAIRLLFLPTGHSLASLPTTPDCPASAPGTSRLRDLIKHLITGNLENHSATPITFSIQPTPPVHTNKNNQSHIYHQDWIASLPIGTYLLYTDGSKLDSGQVGCGATTYEIMHHGIQHLQSHHCNLGTRCEVFDAELHAVYEGLRLVPTSPTTPNTTIYICIHNQAAIQTLAYNQHNHQYARETLATAETLTNDGWNLLTVWTPSHTNITGNEHADTLAKTGAQSLIACPSIITSATWLCAQARQQFLDNWQSALPECQPSFQYPKHLRHLPFRTTRALFRIRSGRTPSDPWQREDPTDCPCGTGTISTHHYLYECTDLTTERDKLRRSTSHNFTLQQLFKDKEGLSALWQFARNTGLGYTKRVECRATALGNDEERIDVGFMQMGFAAFDG